LKIYKNPYPKKSIESALGKALAVTELSDYLELGNKSFFTSNFREGIAVIVIELEKLIVS
jgi:ribosomal protein L13